MAPTVQTNHSADHDKRPRPGERRSELVCRVKYCNTLPDLPFDPKFITYPFESNRFIHYNQTSLERNYKYEVLTEHDLGVTIDLINPATYAVDPNAQLDAADEKLLEEDVMTLKDFKRSRHHAKSVSWLRRTEYISTEQTRFQPQTIDKVEAKVGFSIKKIFKDENLYMDRDSQIKAIEKTFEDVKKPIERHYSKPGVTPVEVLPVFPDFKLWKYPCAQVIFDSDPAPVGRPIPAQIEEMSQAMIRGVMDESGEQFVAYFLPTEETLTTRRRDTENSVEYVDDEEYEYKMAREYNWNVKSKATKGYEENYFFIARDDGVFYDELETRVRLSKRRQKQGQPVGNTKLVVKHRPLNAPEFKMQRFRERQLEPPGELEEDEEEDDDDDDTGSRQGDDDARKSGNESDGSGSYKSNKSGSEKDDSGDEGRGRKSGSEGSERDESDAEGGGKSPQSDASGRKSRNQSGSESRSPSRSPSRSRSGSKSPPKGGSRSGSASSASGSRSASSSNGKASASDSD